MDDRDRRPPCPRCGARSVKNGRTRHGKVNFKCPACGRQFSDPPGKGAIHPVRREIAVSLLSEGIRPFVVARCAGVSSSWAYEQRRRIESGSHVG